MSPKPVVSVIVPTCADRAPRLQSALASIWAQDGLGKQFDIEVIVVDDASWGPTEEVVRRFPGTRYIRLETRSRASVARNAGIAEATGDYVAFLDDDDLWLPHRLSRQVAVLEEASDVEVAYSQRFLCARNGSADGVYPGPDAPSGWVFETAVQKGAIAQVSTVLIPREAVDKVGGFSENLPRGQETDFTTRLALYFRFRFVKGIVVILLPSSTEVSPEQHRKALMTKRDNLLALIEGQSHEAELRKLVLGTTSWHLARLSHRLGEFDRAHRELLQWIAKSRPIEGDAWARSRLREMVFLLADASDSGAQLASLSKDIKRVAAPRGLKQRLGMRALLADAWTEAAVHLGSGRRRDHRKAGSAAARAILQNPLKPLSRPGLLRLAARNMIPL